MADISLQVDSNPGEFFIRLNSVGNIINDRRALSKPLLSGMRMIQRQAKADAPKDTGYLRTQIIAWTNARTSDPLTGFVTVAMRAKRLKNGDFKNSRLMAKRNSGKIVDAITAFYGRFLEFGTRKMPAHPFISRSLEEVGEQARAQVATEARDVMLKLIGERLANL